MNILFNERIKKIYCLKKLIETINVNFFTLLISVKNNNEENLLKSLVISSRVYFIAVNIRVVCEDRQQWRLAYRQLHLLLDTIDNI